MSKSRKIGRKKHSVPRRKPGAAPGTIVAVADSASPEMRVIAYGPEGLAERVVDTATEALEMRSEWQVVWLDVRGLGDADIIKEIVDEIGMHYLAAEDVTTQNQRSKIEEYANGLSIVVRGPAGTSPFESRQLDLFVSPGLVVSFQDRSVGWLEPVRDRIRKGGNRLRKHGVNYLVYALVDAVVDHYFPLLEECSERLAELEHAALDSPSRETIALINMVRSDLLEIRRAVFPLREAITKMLATDLAVEGDQFQIYWRDCADHIDHILDIVEAQSETSRSLINLTLSSMSHQMNEVMKMLTFIATIFIPLGFIAGLYGMNFDRTSSHYNMPELGFAYGYPAVLGLMAVVGLGLVFFFHRKGWIGRGGRRARVSKNVDTKSSDS